MLEMENGGFPRNHMPVPTGNRVLPMFSLKGRTAIVSGSGAGIGLAVAQGFAEAGANVAIWYNSNKQALTEAFNIEKAYGVKCKAYQVNVTSPESVERSINEIVAEFNGRLDIFVANSGVGAPPLPFIDLPVEVAKRVLDVNIEGVMWCARAAGAHFRRQKKEGTTLDGKPLENFNTGSFIATASIGGSIVIVPECEAAYNASKAGVVQFCKSLAVEWTGFARVNTVSPGYFDTDLGRPFPDKVKDQWRGRTVAGRLGLVQELKGAYLYLASDAASFTTGLDMIVDGGYTLP